MSWFWQSEASSWGGGSRSKLHDITGFTGSEFEVSRHLSRAGIVLAKNGACFQHFSLHRLLVSDCGDDPADGRRTARAPKLHRAHQSPMAVRTCPHQPTIVCEHMVPALRQARAPDGTLQGARPVS